MCCFYHNGHIAWNFIVLAYIINFLLNGSSETEINDPDDKYYTNGWAVKLKGKDTFERAKRLASKYGFENVKKVTNFYHKKQLLRVVI